MMDGGAEDVPSDAEVALAGAADEVIDRAFELAALEPDKVVALLPAIVEELSTIISLASRRARRRGTALSPMESGPMDLAATRANDVLGRNQKSRIREAVLLDILQQAAGACALSQLMSGLAARRLPDTQAAVVSHLHRLKASGLISQPGSGFYDITPEGQGHLRKVKASLGSLVP